MINKDGGNAFPFEGTVSPSSSKGMSLRDYFSAKAMQSLSSTCGSYINPEDIAKDAYIIADAMLEVREEK